jgi:tellurite resistance protein TerC
VEFLELLWHGKPLWMWLSFFALVLMLLAFDLGVLHRIQREISAGESLALSAGYISLGMAFGG